MDDLDVFDRKHDHPESKMRNRKVHIAGRDDANSGASSDTLHQPELANQADDHVSQSDKEEVVYGKTPDGKSEFCQACLRQLQSSAGREVAVSGLS
jgi:hypothetical protein